MIARYAIAFFLLLSVVVVPLVAYFLCRWLLPRRWGRKVGVAASVLLIGWALYGMFVGYEQLEVHEVEFVSRDLPEAFDGYRIVQFSDAHIGTMTGNRKWLLQRAVDSILAQRPNMIVFTGDLQNVYPGEIVEHLPQLRRLKAPDGVFSVLGNHDYAVYQSDDSLMKVANCATTQSLERQAGWRLLMNEHHIVRRGCDSIVIAGLENWSSVERMPRRGDVAKTLAGIDTSSFVVMLEHDPTAWRERILPECGAQLTLSGHTHGGQACFLGQSPASFAYREWQGWAHEGSRSMYVSTGLGALIPFRLGMPGEIVVITLKRQR